MRAAGHVAARFAAAAGFVLVVIGDPIGALAFAALCALLLRLEKAS